MTIHAPITSTLRASVRPSVCSSRSFVRSFVRRVESGGGGPSGAMDGRRTAGAHLPITSDHYRYWIERRKSVPAATRDKNRSACLPPTDPTTASPSTVYTVEMSVYPRIFRCRVFRIFTERDPSAFVAVNRRNDEARGHVAILNHQKCFRYMQYL